EEEVARMQAVAELLLDVLAERRQRESEDRQVLGLLEHVAVAVVQAGHVVLGLAQDRRPGGLLHRDAHLVGDRAESARVDRQQDRIDFHGFGGAHFGISVEVQAATGAGSATAAGPNADRQRSSRPLRKIANEPSASTTQSYELLTKIAVVACSIIAGPAMRLPKRIRWPS